MRNTERTKRKVSAKMIAFIISLLVAGAIVTAIYFLVSTPGEVPPIQ